MHVGVVPQAHDLVLAADNLDLAVDQVDDLGEGLLSGGGLLRVDVGGLQEREEQLAGATVIRVRCCEHNWNIQSLKRLQALVAHMIRSIVGQNYRISSPSFPLSIQNRAQLLEEDAHGLRVVVALTHGIVDVSKSI